MPGLYFDSGIDKGFEKDLKKMNTQYNQFSSNVDSRNNAIDSSFLRIGKTLAGVFSVGAFAAAGKEVVNFSTTVETALTEVATISDEVTDNFGDFKNQLLALSTDELRGAAGAEALTNAFYDIVSAGNDATTAMDLLAVAGLAATAGSSKGIIDVAAAGDGLTTVLNAFNKEASEAAEVSDIFFTIVERGKTTFPELGTGMSKVASLAASMDVSFKEIGGAMATMTAQGIPTQEAFTQIRAALTAVNGVLGDGWSEAMTYQEALAEVSKRAGGSQNKLKEMLGSVEAVNAVLAVTGKNASAASKDLEAMGNSLGATQRAAEKMADTTDVQLKILKNNILAALEPLGAEASGVIASFAKTLNEAFQSGDLQRYAKIITKLITAFAAYKVITLSVNQVKKLGIELAKQEGLAEAESLRAKLTGEQKKQLGITNSTKLTQAHVLAIKEVHLAELKSAQIELEKQKAILATIAFESQAAKQRIIAVQQRIQAEKVALSIAIQDKNLAAAKTAQTKIAALEEQKATLIIARKTATANAANTASKINILQTKAQTIQTTLGAAADKRAAVSKNLLTQASFKLGKGLKGLGRAFAANPIGLLVTGLSLAIPLIKEFGNETSTAVKIQEALVDVNTKAEQSVNQQKVQLNKLLAIAKDETKSLAERQSAVEALNKISPEYLGGLKVQTINTESAKEATDKYTQSLIRNAKAKAADAKLVGIQDELTALRTGAQKEELSYYQQAVNGIKNIAQVEGYIAANRRTEFENRVKRGIELLKIQKAVLKVSLENSNVTPIKSTGNIGSTGNKGASGKKQQETITYYAQLKEALEDAKRGLLEFSAVEGEINLGGIKAQKTIIESIQTRIAQQEKILGLADKGAKSESTALEGSIRLLEDKLSTEKEIFELATSNEVRKASKERSDELERQIETARLMASEDKVTQEGSLRFLEEKLVLAKEVFALATSYEARDAAAFEIKSLEEQINKIKALTESTEQGNVIWKDRLELMNGLNTLLSDTINSIGGLSESTQNLLTGVSESVTGFINMAQAIKAVGVAAGALETASGIVALISTALKVVFALLKATKNASEIRQKAQIDELINIKEINIELIKQNALYKAGNEFFASDKWGTALAGLDAYNTALGLQEENYQRIAAFNADLGNTDPWGGQADAARVAQARVELYATAVGKALALIQVRTKDRSKFNIFQSDDYKGLLEVYPDLINANGRLNTSILETVIATADVSDANRELLTGLLETTEAAEEAYGQFGDYISGIFGGVGDDITKVFQTMYETGEDAMSALEGTFSEMIESFTRDALEFAFLQPYINELNIATKALGESYARGEVSAEELQTNIINTLGTFYDQMAELQPQILSAFENADRIAEAAGFADAFEPDDTELDQEVIVEPEIILPEIIIPEIIIPEIIMEDPIIPEIITEDPIIPEATTPVIEEIKDASTPGQISQSITEQTGTILSGRIGAMVLSNEKILNANKDALDYAIQNLIYVKEIRDYAAYLPEIADNTRKTYEKLESV